MEAVTADKDSVIGGECPKKLISFQIKSELLQLFLLLDRFLKKSILQS